MSVPRSGLSLALPNQSGATWFAWTPAQLLTRLCTARLPDPAICPELFESVRVRLVLLLTCWVVDEGLQA